MSVFALDFGYECFSRFGLWVSALGPPLLKKPRFQLSFEGGFADNEITGVWFLYSDDSDEALYAGVKY